MTQTGRRTLCAALAAWPLLAQADLTLDGYSAIGAFGVPMSSPEQIRIHGTQIRRDFVDRGRAQTLLFDLAKHQVAVVDHASRMIEMHDLKGLQETTEVSAPASGLSITLTPTGRMQPLQHWKCEAHTLSASMPARLGTEATVFHLNGELWIARNVPEQAAVKQLVKLTQQSDFFLGVPAVAKVTPAQSRLLSEILRKLAPKGLPCGGQLDASYEGTGPMANLARRMPARLGMAFRNYSTDAIKPDVFDLPAGYVVRPAAAGFALK